MSSLTLSGFAVSRETVKLLLTILWKGNMKSNNCISTKYSCSEIDHMYRVTLFWWNDYEGNGFVHRLMMKRNLLLSFFPYLIIGRINRRLLKLHLLHIFMKSQCRIRYILKCIQIINFQCWDIHEIWTS